MVRFVFCKEHTGFWVESGLKREGQEKETEYWMFDLLPTLTSQHFQ